VLRDRRFERGQGVVEFALASTVLFVVIFGIIDFGRAFYTFDLITSAARIGSRYAIVHGSSCTLAICPVSSAAIQTYVQSQVTGINTSELTVSASWSTAPGCTDTNHQGPLCLVTVTASYPFKFVLAFNKTITMSASSQMTISQ